MGSSSSKDSSVKNNNVVQRGGKSPTDSTPTNTLFEEVFYVTLGIAVGSDLPEFCVHTKETFAKYQKDPILTTENIEESVLERTEMVNPRVHLLKSKSPGQSDKSALNAHERMALRYLYQSYLRLKMCEGCNKYSTMKDELQKCKEVIFLQTKRCLLYPDKYKQQSVHNQFIDLCIEHAKFLLESDKHFNEFVMGTVEQFDKDKDDNGCQAAFNPILEKLQTRFAKEYTLSHRD